MLDFNNPFLSAQEKRDLLHLEVSAEYREEKKRMAQAGMLYSSSSYWELSIGEFSQLAKASQSLDTLFAGELAGNLFHPNQRVLLMEHDRVEAGEWDNFHQRFNPTGYQNVCVIGVNGILEGEVPISHEEINGAGIWRHSGKEYEEQIREYTETAYWSKQSDSFFPIAIWDIPLNELNQYEDKRVWKNTYIFSRYFEFLMDQANELIQAVGVMDSTRKAEPSLKISRRGFASCDSACPSKNNKSGKKGKNK